MVGKVPQMWTGRDEGKGTKWFSLQCLWSLLWWWSCCCHLVVQSSSEVFQQEQQLEAHHCRGLVQQEQRPHQPGLQLPQQAQQHPLEQELREQEAGSCTLSLG